ncbi:MAG: zinc ribbon domain-containing protein [Thermoplasmata archaeon]|nr:zinc ribbon domain-containing protein [Thermoplasmata archaeon]
MLLREEETIAEESMGFTKQCSVCGKLNPEDAKFCAYCGTTLDIISRFRQSDNNTRNNDRTIHCKVMYK